MKMVTFLLSKLRRAIKLLTGDSMAFKLRDHQLDALERMKNGCILCGGVGSGKSRTAIAYYYKEQGGGVNQLRRMIQPKDLYIITTARKRDTEEWEGELIPFLLSTKPEINSYKNKIVVDSWNNIGKYANIEGAFFIFDEQRVVGYGPWAKAFIKIAHANDWILLSATPGDKWIDYMAVFIANGFYKNKTQFVERHVTYKRYCSHQEIDHDKYRDKGRLRYLRDYILIDMDYKKQTMSHHENIFINYDNLLYKTVMRSRWNPYSNEPIVNASALCNVLRRVVNSDPSRIEKVIELVKERDRVIIFYNFDFELEILRNAEYGSEYIVAEWNGHCHQPIPDSEKWVYLVQYTAGAEGWNCILTDTIIFFSQNYSYRTMVQASGRIDRLNTPYHDLYFYHLKSRAPIDIAISRAIEAKRQFNAERFVSKLFKSGGKTCA